MKYILCILISACCCYNSFGQTSKLDRLQIELKNAENLIIKAIDLYTAGSVASNTNWMLGYCYGMVGEHEKANKILDYQLNKNKMVYVPALMIATIYMGLGEKENALLYLEKDYELGGQGLFFWGLKHDIKFEPLKNEPRFQALLAKI